MTSLWLTVDTFHVFFFSCCVLSLLWLISTCVQRSQPHKRSASSVILAHQCRAGPETRTSGMTHVEWTLNYFTCFWNTRMKRQAWKKNKGKRDVEKKKGRQLHGKAGEGGEGGEGRDVGSGVRGGLQAEQRVNGERRASLTRSLARHFLLAECPVQLLLCVSSTINPPSSHALCLFFFCFVFLWLAALAEVHCFRRWVLVGLKRRAAVRQCKTFHFINVFCPSLRQREKGRQRQRQRNWTLLNLYQLSD